MACITEHHLNDYTVVGVWKIEEDIDTLLGMVSLDQNDLVRYKSFRSNSRKLEFLSVRALLKELLGGEAKIRAIVTDVLQNHLDNPVVNVRYQDSDRDEVVRVVTEFVCAGTGGLPRGICP